MPNKFQTYLALLIRHGLTWGGGLIIAKTGLKFQLDPVMLASLAATAAGLIWSFLHKGKVGKLLDTALSMTAGSTPEQLAAKVEMQKG